MLVSIITLLLMIVAGIAVIYGIGLISPLTKNMFFGMVFGAPDFTEIIICGVITLVPSAIFGLIIFGLYKAGKFLYRFYS